MAEIIVMTYRSMTCFCPPLPKAVGPALERVAALTRRFFLSLWPMARLYSSSSRRIYWA